MTTLENTSISYEMIPGDGISIASIGDHNTFVSLKLRHLGAVVELVAELSIFHPISGATDIEEVARRFGDDEGDAVNIAIDLQRAARKRLAELDVSDADIFSDPDDFGEALEAHFEREAAGFAFAAE